MAQEAEFAGLPPPSGFGPSDAASGAAAMASATPFLSSTFPTPVKSPPPPFSPLLDGVLDPDKAGLMSPDAAEPAPGPAPPRRSEAEVKDEELALERLLVANAPQSLGAVVTATMDEEDQTQNAVARLGYSARTEKMHKYLAGKFQDTGESQALSYGQLCKQQAAGRRELIAGCFFELLVLRTNGVISLQQEAPLADIEISKANSWAAK